MYRLSTAVPVLLLLALFGIVGCSGDHTTPATATANDGASTEADAPELRKAPDFKLKALDGSTFRLSEQEGNVVLVNFWATWCGPCIRETPEFIELHDELKGRGFTVVGVSLDLEGFDIVKPFAEEYGINYPLVVDDGAVAEDFGGVYALPVTFVLDKEGYIVARFYGMFPFEDMRPLLEEML